MNNKKTVFLTGATGLVGSYLLKVLLQNGYRVYALARSKDNKNPRDRVIDVLKFWDKDILSKHPRTSSLSPWGEGKGEGNNLIVLEGDITKKNLGLDKQNIDLLKNEIEEIFHCAASIQFNAPLDVLREINVEGTQKILELCSEWEAKGRLNKINYLSTIFICGNYKGTFKEGNFDLGQSFNNNYEQSKFEAENVVRNYKKKGMRVLIFRPSIVVGNYNKGKTLNFKTFYEPLHVFSLEIFPEVPLNTKTVLNLIPVDLAAKAIYVLSTNINKNGVYHITSPKAFPIRDIFDEASNFFNFKKPKFVGLKRYNTMRRSPASEKLLEVFKPYFNFRALFSSNNTQTALKKYGFKYPSIDNEFLYRMFNFCNEHGFVKIKRKID